jgi:hypothetical protein
MVPDGLLSLEYRTSFVPPYRLLQESYTASPAHGRTVTLITQTVDECDVCSESAKGLWLDSDILSSLVIVYNITQLTRLRHIVNPICLISTTTALLGSLSLVTRTLSKSCSFRVLVHHRPFQIASLLSPFSVY